MLKQLPHKYIAISDAKYGSVSGKTLIVNVSEIIWIEPD